MTTAILAAAAATVATKTTATTNKSDKKTTTNLNKDLHNRNKDNEKFNYGAAKNGNSKKFKKKRNL